MDRRVRLPFTILVLLCGVLPTRAVQDTALERGTAITDPPGLRDLDRGRFGLSHLLAPMRSGAAPIANGESFALPSMAPVRKALDGEFERYIARHKADLPNETVGVGSSYDFGLFDRTLLYSADSRFMLAGIVNRMDRAYVSEANCGEIRLIDSELTIRVSSPQLPDRACRKEAWTTSLSSEPASAD
jgi:hypothetical protein